MTLLFPLFLIPALASLAAFAWLRTSAGQDDWRSLLDQRVLAALRPVIGRRYRDPALLVLAVVFAALASPAIKADVQSSYALNEGVAVLIDVSKSMTLSDVRPDRLAAARATALAISARAGARPTALVLYAGDAYLAEPFAVDRRQFDAFVSALQYGLVAEDGSALGRALALTASVLDQAGVASARVVILTDGGGFDARTADVAARLHRKGHRIDAVLFAAADTVTPVRLDQDLIVETVGKGGGIVIPSNPEGAVDLDGLDLAAPFLSGANLYALSLRSTDWQNLSHYLMILALAPLLMLFRRAAR